jgi:hypothetical protein
MYVVVIGWGKYEKVDHLEGKGGESVVAIPRVHGDSPQLCR